jgi:myo-inositol-1(or 4)-monophosphatase
MSVTDADLAVAAAEAGAAVVRARFGADLPRIAKGALDFATAADLEAERVIRDVIGAARPDDAVVGEESGRTGPPGATRTWLVDPLCGTPNFAAGDRLVGVNVALGTPAGVAAAATVDPFAGEAFWTDGAGAYVRRAGRDDRLRPSARSRIVDVNLDPPFPNGPGFRAVRLLADDRFGALFLPRVVSTTLALAWVAAGRRAGYVTDGDLRDNVHFASGIALCRAAGCVVTDLWGRPLGDRVAGLLVAADARTHATLRALIP